MFDLSGQVALITGSSRGIGLAAARALGRQGATVIINGRDPASLTLARDHLVSLGIETFVLPFDITDINESTQAVDAISKQVGKIDIFFSNAGIQHREKLLDFPLSDFERVVFANLTAQWALGRHIAVGMHGRGYGRIIFTGSITALLGRREVTAYTAAKAAMHGIVRQWASELSASGITVNAVAPGYIKTELTTSLWHDPEFTTWLESRVPVGQWGDPDDIAAALVFLAARESRFITGQVLVVDGGLSSSM